MEIITIGIIGIVILVAVIVAVILVMNSKMKSLEESISRNQESAAFEQKEQINRQNEKINLINSQLTASMGEINRSLGEMKTLASGVEELKKLMSNVKSRGIVGEVQLGAILADILSPEQYEINVAVKGGTERVEYAVRFPGEDGKSAYLPIDSKFPGDAYLNLLEAYDSGDRNEIKRTTDLLRQAIIKGAKDIKSKYIYPPYTTDFAIMFLPFEGLYAEILRLDIVEELQRTYRVTIAGPTTMAAMINSFHMGFRSIALQQSSGRVWETLEKVKTEFDTFAQVLNNVQNRLDQSQNELEKLVGTRTRAIQKALDNLEK